ncbi:uncharacterized protein JCM15063_000286 [Sporobolomyces koalae]|uniref:uncharacterized protein n=1 Tax=Sporobolomyces koalae TaxID=500713 RepID=UPI003177F584
MSPEPDYNVDHPVTLLEKGILQGRAVGVDVATIRPHPRGGDTFLATADSHPDSATGPKLLLVKIVPDFDKSREPRNGRREAKLLAKLAHPNIIPLLNAYLDPPSPTTLTARITLFIPFHPYTLRQLLDFADFVPKAGDSSFSDLSHSIASQLLDAVAYLHDLQISHRDISPSNIVLSEDGLPVLIDFGIAVQAGDEQAGQQYFEVGTGPYRAPELVFASRAYEEQAIDLWALGTTISEMFRPFSSPDPASPASSDRSDSADPFQHYSSVDRTVSPTRQSLFTSGSSDFVLAASIFRVIGTPTLGSWPEANLLPNFTRFSFASFPETSLATHLPHLESTSPLLEILESMLVCSASKRLTAQTAHDRIGRRPAAVDTTRFLESILG